MGALRHAAKSKATFAFAAEAQTGNPGANWKKPLTKIRKPRHKTKTQKNTAKPLGFLIPPC